MARDSIEKIRENLKRRKRVNTIFAIAGLLTILTAISILLGLSLQMLIEGAPRLRSEFFLSFPSRKPEQAGILSAWVGTTLVILVTAIAAVPLGVASGIYLEEYARKNWLSDLIEINVTNLAGVPSIVYGLLALGLFAYQFNLGESVLTAGLTLALLILPVVIVTTREALRAIPKDLREASYALGASKWQTIWNHIFTQCLNQLLSFLHSVQE